MNTPITPWIELTLHQTQRCHHLAWFLYGWVEREQVLNLEAFVTWWLRGAAAVQRLPTFGRPSPRIPRSALRRVSHQPRR